LVEFSFMHCLNKVACISKVARDNIGLVVPSGKAAVLKGLDWP
jgi:hypothetical protein